MEKRLTLTREELFDRVWNKPIREVAGELGISDVGLAKKCRKNGIPLPPQGYWLRSDESPTARPRPALPALMRGQMNSFTFVVRQEDARINEGRECRENALSILKSADIPAALRHPEVAPLLRQFKKSINRSNLDERGIMRSAGELPWAIRTAKAHADRALEILHAIHTRLHLLGYTFRTDDKHQTMVCFKAEGSEFWLWIEEHATRQERPLSAKELQEKQIADRTGGYFWHREKWLFTPNGKLVLKMDKANWKYPIKTWSDGVKPNLERRLDDIAADIAVIAREVRIKAEQDALEAAAQASARLLRQQQLQRIQHEKLKQKQLLREARNWVAADNLRRYIQAVANTPISALPNLPDEHQRESWLAWARESVSALDPISSGSAATVPPLPALSERSWEDC